MFLDENGVPFMGGTYFSKRDKKRFPSFKEVLQKVSHAYKDQRLNILETKRFNYKDIKSKKKLSIKSRS